MSINNLSNSQVIFALENLFFEPILEVMKNNFRNKNGN